MRDRRIRVYLLKPKDRANYQMQWLDEFTGLRTTESTWTDNADEAEDKRADQEYELNHGRYAKGERMEWEQVREQFEEEYVSGWRRNTRRNYQRTLDLFEEICAPKRVRLIDEQVVSKFVAGMRRYRIYGRVGFNPSSIRARLQLFHSVLSWAVEQKVLEEIPAFPTVKVPDKDPQPVPAESFERLLAKAPDAPMRAFLLCGWLAGLRLSEAFYLEWEETDKAPWVDLARRRIIFPAEFVKAAKDQWVPLDPELRAALEDLPRHGRRVFRFLDPQGKPVLAEGIGRRVRDLAKRAGVKMTMHTLRKGFGCRYAAKVSAHVLQKLLRHANIKTAMKFYANIDAAVEEAVVGPRSNAGSNGAPQGVGQRQRGIDERPLEDGRSGDGSIS
jgi:integrase